MEPGSEREKLTASRPKSRSLPTPFQQPGFLGRIRTRGSWARSGGLFHQAPAVLQFQVLENTAHFDAAGVLKGNIERGKSEK